MKPKHIKFVALLALSTMNMQAGDISLRYAQRIFIDQLGFIEKLKNTNLDDLKREYKSACKDAMLELFKVMLKYPDEVKTAFSEVHQEENVLVALATRLQTSKNVAIDAYPFIVAAIKL